LPTSTVTKKAELQSHMSKAKFPPSRNTGKDPGGDAIKGEKCGRVLLPVAKKTQVKKTHGMCLKPSSTELKLPCEKKNEGL